MMLGGIGYWGDDARVSILVVLDWTMMLYPWGTHCSPAREVSILVVLDWTMMLGVFGWITVGYDVSILVVLDWTMMHGRRTGKRPIVTGFNPCCIGLDNDARLALGSAGWRWDCFNPCCIGLDNDAQLKGMPCAEFKVVSILVVLDWTMMPDWRGGRLGGGGLVSILVVLDWTMMRPTLPIRAGDLFGFNPCCIGLDNDAVDGASQRCVTTLFQSLLYWIGQ